MKRKIFIIALIAMLACSACGKEQSVESSNSISANSKEIVTTIPVKKDAVEINLNDYLTEPKFDTNFKVSGAGSLSSSGFDVDEVVEELNSKYNLSTNWEEVNKHIGGSWDKETALSNGDIITWNWELFDIETFEEKYNVKFKYESTTAEVSGYEESMLLDPLDYVVIQFIDSDENGEYEMINNNGNPPMDTSSIETNTQYDDYDFESYVYERGTFTVVTEGYHIGDTVTITFTLNEDDSYDSRYLGFEVVPSSERTFTVSEENILSW